MTHVLIEENAGVLRLVLNRPDKKNALTREMYRALAAELHRADRSSQIRCVLIEAAGETFSAGNDLSEFQALATNGQSLEEAVPLLAALARVKTPLVAAVQGRAVGIGTTMLLHCDFVILSEEALLSTPFVNLALVPEAASSILLPARIGHCRAFEMLVLGEPVSAARAFDWGIANRIVARTELAASARAVADAIASQPSNSVVATKVLMRNSQNLMNQMIKENVLFARQLASPEFREAAEAFVQRRKPDFSRLQHHEPDNWASDYSHLA